MWDAKLKSKEFTLKEFKIENAPVGSRFIDGAHSTLLIVTDRHDKSMSSKTVACVSESGMYRSINYGTIVMCIKEANDYTTALSRSIISRVINDPKIIAFMTKKLNQKKKQ